MTSRIITEPVASAYTTEGAPAGRDQPLRQ